MSKIFAHLNKNSFLCTDFLRFEFYYKLFKTFIVEKLGVDEAEVKPEASFTNDLGADSLDTVELIMEFEKEFNISIPDDKAETIATVGDAISYIEANMK